jgi:hypothetical protein
MLDNFYIRLQAMMVLFCLSNDGISSMLLMSSLFVIKNSLNVVIHVCNNGSLCRRAFHLLFVASLARILVEIGYGVVPRVLVAFFALPKP